MTPAATQDLMHDIGRRRAWAVWSVALGVYVLAVLHRSSLGVAGLLAAERFAISSTELAAFTVLQLLVYAAMQVPVGVLLDRWGPRRMLLGGLVLMTAGQLAFAFADTFTAGLWARGLLGAGDAMVFISVMRLVAVWFLVRQAPMVAQVTGQVGQLGAVLAAAPLSLALQGLGWTRTFAAISSAGILLMAAVGLMVKDSPYRRSGAIRTKVTTLARSLRLLWGNPGTRLGMWSHFTSQFSVTVFSLLWGFPYLVRGEGLSPTVAGTLLILITGTGMVSGWVLARLVARHPFHRSHIVLAVVAAIVTVWTVVLLWRGPAPLWLLVLLVCVTATGGPASMVGFDLARTFTPVRAIGRANGMINSAGFLASLATVALIGLVLDLREPRGPAAYELADFRVAMCAQYPFWLLGIVQIVRFRRKAVAHLERVHPGAVAAMKRGEMFVHPGTGEGV